MIWISCVENNIWAISKANDLFSQILYLFANIGSGSVKSCIILLYSVFYLFFSLSVSFLNLLSRALYCMTWTVLFVSGYYPVLVRPINVQIYLLFRAYVLLTVLDSSILSSCDPKCFAMTKYPRALLSVIHRSLAVSL